MGTEAHRKPSSWGRGRARGAQMIIWWRPSTSKCNAAIRRPARPPKQRAAAPQAWRGRRKCDSQIREAGAHRRCTSPASERFKSQLVRGCGKIGGPELKRGGFHRYFCGEARRSRERSRTWLLDSSRRGHVHPRAACKRSSYERRSSFRQTTRPPPRFSSKRQNF